jgi:hypothetical protein
MTESAAHNALKLPYVLDHIFVYLDALELVRFSQVCRTVHCAYDEHVLHALVRRLSRFFRDPSKFRSIQARGGTLISGSFALQFFDRTFYPDSDLDLYLYYGEAKAMGQYLFSEGYTYIPRFPENPVDFETEEPVGNCRVEETWEEVEEVLTWEDDTYGDVRDLHRVYYFERIEDDGSTRRVQLMVARYSLMDAILTFHSS